MAIEFVTVNGEYLNCGSDASLDNIVNLSVAVWMFCDAQGFTRTVDKNVAGATAGWTLNFPGATKLQFYRSFSGNDGYWYSPVASVPLSVWKHVVFTYINSATGNSPVFYIDGILAATTLGGAPTGVADADAANSLHWAAGAGANTFDGKLEDGRVYDRILTAEEAAALGAGYRGPLGGEVSWLSMTEARDVAGGFDGAVLANGTNLCPDLSVNSNDGDPVNTPTGRASVCSRMGLTV